MLNIEAIEGVEREMSQIGLTDCYGDKIVGIEASGWMHKHIGEPWDKAHEDAMKGIIDATQWHDRCVELIKLARTIRFSQTFDKVINKLNADPT